MMSMFERIFNRKPQSSDVAKDRLKLLLVHDRINCSTELLEMMKADIIEVISKYADIDDEGFNIEIESLEIDKTHKKSPMLSANIPIKSLKKRD